MLGTLRSVTTASSASCGIPGQSGGADEGTVARSYGGRAEAKALVAATSVARGGENPCALPGPAEGRVVWFPQVGNRSSYLNPPWGKPPTGSRDGRDG